MSKVSNKTKFWTKGFIFSFLFLLLSAILIMLLVINHVFIQIPWIDLLYEILRPWLLLIFFEYSLYVYSIIFICYTLLLVLYVLGYNLAKVKHLTGSIVYIFSLLGFVFVTFISSYYTYFSLLFIQNIALTTRLMLLILFLPMNFI